MSYEALDGITMVGRQMTCWRWGKGIASEAEAEGGTGTDRNRETPRAWGGGVISGGGSRTNIYWR